MFLPGRRTGDARQQARAASPRRFARGRALPCAPGGAYTASLRKIPEADAP